MPLCASLVHSARRDAAWSACPRLAQRGDLLCAEHRDAPDGLVLGILDSNYLAHVRHKRKAARKDGASLAFSPPRIDFLSVEPLIHRPARPRRRKRLRRKRKGDAAEI